LIDLILQEVGSKAQNDEGDREESKLPEGVICCWSRHCFEAVVVHNEEEQLEQAEWNEELSDDVSSH
jgi:hypothetical protein